jgi:acetyl esterase/lipase
MSAVHKIATCLLTTTLASAALTALGGVPASAAPPSQLSAAPHARGHWSVQTAHAGVYRVTWTSPTALPLTDARPEILLDGRSVGNVSLTRSTVSALVHVAVAPTTSRLDVRLSGRLLDSTATNRPSRPAAPYTQPKTTPLAADPGKPGDHQVVTSEYTLPATKIVDMPQKVEMVAHVVRPKDADESDPLVLFLHGRHSTCYTPKREGTASAIARSEVLAQPTKLPVWQCPTGQIPIPSYQGYDYIQQLLASQGYVTVSISADAINALDYTADDGGAAARADLIRHHLDKWVRWIGKGKYSADLQNVFLVGHSRGGEGVARAAIVIPKKAPYTITGEVLIAPTDFGYQAPAYIPTVTLLGYCDGDVSDLEGQIFTDYSRDLAPGDLGLHSSVLMMGADHNFFNTEWTPGQSQAPSGDDWGGSPSAPCGSDDPARLSATEQQKAAKTYIAGAVQLAASGKNNLLPMFDGSDVHVKSAGRADVRSHTIGAGRELREPGSSATLGDANNATTQICVGRGGGSDPTWCGRGLSYGQMPHWIGGPSQLAYKPAFEMSWTTSGGFGGLDFTDPLDLSSSASLDLRTAVDPTVGDVQLSVRLRDSNGDSTVVTPVDDGVVPALEVGSPPLSKRFAQNLRVPLDGVNGVDLSSITGVDLITESATGHVFVLDVASVPTSLPAAQSTRLAYVDLLDSTVKRHGTKGFTAKIPYRVVNSLTHDATILVTTSSTSFTVDIPAGTHQGTFKYKVPAGGGANIEFDAFATQYIMTGDYTGHLSVTV